jgi:hypothetical protein
MQAIKWQQCELVVINATKLKPRLMYRGHRRLYQPVKNDWNSKRQSVNTPADIRWHSLH